MLFELWGRFLCWVQNYSSKAFDLIRVLKHVVPELFKWNLSIPHLIDLIRDLLCLLELLFENFWNTFNELNEIFHLDSPCFSFSIDLEKDIELVLDPSINPEQYFSA